MRRLLLLSFSLVACGRTGLVAGAELSFGVDAGQPKHDSADAGVVVADDSSCPADRFAAEGSPCPKEGVFCGSCSPSPCEWCNLLTCADHRWQNIEAFPAPPEVCAFDCGSGGLTCDHFLQACVEHFGRDMPCAAQFSCETLPKGCAGCGCFPGQACEALDGGGVRLSRGCN